MYRKRTQHQGLKELYLTDLLLISTPFAMVSLELAPRMLVGLTWLFVFVHVLLIHNKTHFCTWNDVQYG